MSDGERPYVCMECQGTGFSGNDVDHPCPYCDAGLVAKRAKEIYDQRLDEARQEFKELLDESLSEAIEYRKGIEKQLSEVTYQSDLNSDALASIAFILNAAGIDELPFSATG